MSEEEKKAIEHTERFCYGKQLWEEDLECIKALLNLIEKQNNRLEQLEKENKEYRKDYVEYKKQEPQQLSIKKLAEEILNLKANSIPKSVIRDKIEELEKEFHFFAGRCHHEWQDGEFDDEVCDELALKIGVLKKLLEE